MQSQHSFFTKPINQQIGDAASEYANSIILKSCTALAWNRLPQDRQEMLIHGISDVRRNAQDILFSETFRVDQDDLIFKFLRSNEITRKYSLGNCLEYANLALEYIYDNFPSINAELYHIINGDHAFVVIGRLPTSDVNNPEEWGADAYICDPWVDQVYPAAQYNKCLKTFIKREFGREQYNLHILLRPEHVLDRYNNANTNYLDKQESFFYKIQMLFKFKEKILCIQNVIEYLSLKLNRYAKEESSCAKSLLKIGVELKQLKEALEKISVERQVDAANTCKKIRGDLMYELYEIVQKFNKIVTPLTRNEMKVSIKSYQMIDNILRTLSANLRGESLSQYMFEANLTLIQNEASASAVATPMR